MVGQVAFVPLARQNIVVEKTAHFVEVRKERERERRREAWF